MYCLNHLAQLGRMYDELQGRGAQVFVIGAAPHAKASHIAEIFKSPFAILADPSRSTYMAYGFSKVLGLIQKSGTVLVDRAGVIRYLHRVANPQHSLKTDELLEAVAQLK